jgi:hypothetical protein
MMEQAMDELFESLFASLLPAPFSDQATTPQVARTALLLCAQASFAVLCSFHARPLGSELFLSLPSTLEIPALTQVKSSAHVIFNCLFLLWLVWATEQEVSLTVVKLKAIRSGEES